LRILQLVTRNELRGAEVFAGQLSEGLVARGHTVMQAGLYRLRDDSTPLDSTSVELVDLGGRVQGRIEWQAIRNLLALVRQQKPDLIQANGFHALKYAGLLAKFARVRPPIVYRNISIASGWANKRFKRSWGRWLCKSLTFVSSVSRQSADDFSRFYQFPPQRVTVIHRGIEIPDQVLFCETRAKLASLVRSNASLNASTAKEISDSAQLICHVGGFTPEKNHVGLLQAFTRIHQSLPDAHLVLFGDGPLRGEIGTLAESGLLKGRIHFLGFRPDARDLIAGCDLMLLSSRIEGIPGVVLEAAARQIPAVCTNVGAVAEFIEHGVNGRLVDVGDMSALADAAVALLTDEAARQQAGKLARQKVREQYSMQRAVNQFEELYRDAINGETQVRGSLVASC
jgi:glycosyltransferase involved in cell wall biosynthesis